MTEVIPKNNLSPNAAPWGRWVTDKITTLTTLVKRNINDQANQNKQTNASIKTLARQVLAAPVLSTAGDLTTGLNLPLTPTTRNALIVAVPAGKTVANCMVIVNAQYVDTVSGGAAVAYSQVFIDPLPTVNSAQGISSPKVSAAKDAGASAVNNILNIGYAGKLTGLSQDTTPYIYVTVYGSATSNSAYPASGANFSQLSVQITFSN